MTTTPATNPITPTTDATIARADQLAALSVTIRLGLMGVQDGTMSNDQCAEIHDARCAIKRMVKELDAEAEDAFVTRLKAHGKITLALGPDGKPSRWLYAAPNTSTKSKDNTATLNALMDMGGDVHGVAECLASQPFRHGAVNKKFEDHYGSCLGGDRFGELFEIIVTSKTKEGKTKDKVQIADDTQRR